MSPLLIEGIGMGLLLSSMIGPVFFALVQNSLQHGFRYAAVLALGILLSDCIYVVFTFVGVEYLSSLKYFEVVLGYAGGLVLMGFGFLSIVKKKVIRPNTGGVPILKPKKRTAFLKGFGINGINPFVLLFWVSIASLLQLKNDIDLKDVGFYYGGVLLTVFIIDLLKAFIAKQLSGFVTARTMRILNLAVGVLLISFGLRMMYFAYEKHLLLQ
jgi:threonine/homoserine/homoserine lactone efflux protein